jgi:hypothetical protein
MRCDVIYHIGCLVDEISGDRGIFGVRGYLRSLVPSFFLNLTL